MIKNSAVFKKIIQQLRENQVKYQLLEHPPVFTSAQAAAVRGTRIEQGAKAIVFFADRQPVLIVVPADKRISTKKFKQQYQIKDLMILSPEQVKEVTQLEVGAIPPFGNLMGLPTYIDKDLLKEEIIAFNPGGHTKTIKMKSKDLIALVGPETGRFSE